MTLVERSKILATAFVALAPGAFAAQAARAEDPKQPIEIHVSLRDAHHDEPTTAPPVCTSRIAAKTSGHVHVWAISTDFDPLLRVESADGKVLAEDDDSGGGTTPYVSVAVEAGDELRVTVLPSTADSSAHGSSGDARVFSCEMPETETTLAAADALRMVVDEAERRRGEQKLGASRAALKDAVERALATPGIERSEALHDGLYLASYQLNLLEESQTALPLDRVLCEWFAETRPPYIRTLQVVRLRLAQDLIADAKAAEGLPIAELALSCSASTRPDDHPDVQIARMIVGRVANVVGDVVRAEEVQRRALEIAGLDSGSDELNIAALRGNLGTLLLERGDALEARGLFELAIETLEPRVPEDNPNLLRAYTSLASTLRVLGDHEKARLLDDKALAICERTMSPDDPRSLLVRQNTGIDLCAAGEFEAALELYRSVLDGLVKIHPESHPEVLRGRMYVAEALLILDRGDEAREMLEKTLEIELATLPENDLLVQRTRGVVARYAMKVGQYDRALELFEAVHRVQSANLPDDHTHLQNTLCNLAMIHSALGHWNRTRELMSIVARSVEKHIQSVVLCMPPREVEAVATSEMLYISNVLSVFDDQPSSEPRTTPGSDEKRDAFRLVETARSAGRAAQRCMQRIRVSSTRGELEGQRHLLQRATAQIAKLSKDGDVEGQLAAAIERKEHAERAMLGENAARDDDESLARNCDPRVIAAGLRVGEVAIGFRVYGRAIGRNLATAAPVASLTAFVLAQDGSLARVELGPLADIDDAVRRWREALLLPQREGVETLRTTGQELSRRIIEPLEHVAGSARHWIVALDGPLHLIPLDALQDKDGVVGDRIAIVVRPTLSEIAEKRAPLELAGKPGEIQTSAAPVELVALGGVDYDAEPATEPQAAHDAKNDRGRALPAEAMFAAANIDIVRSGPRSKGFAPLSATVHEVRTISDVFQEAFGNAGRSTLLDGSEARKSELVRLAGRARFLHIATHGYVARDASSANDPDFDRSENILLKTHHSVEESLSDLSPMVLCGLALAGANRPAGIGGMIEGVITAEELGALDLDRCELAVLSACDTNVGDRIKGQGIASFQKALHAAGARTVVTSLWRVNDAAARELMAAFYRGIWIEKLGKSEALWRAKKSLRDRRAPLRDWAGWVLSGDSD